MPDLHTLFRNFIFLQINQFQIIPYINVRFFGTVILLYYSLCKRAITRKNMFFNLRLLIEMRECAPYRRASRGLLKKIQKNFKKTVTFSIFADYIYRTFNKSKICIFARFIYTFAFAVFRSGVLRYNFCARQTSATPFSRIVYLI